MFYRDCFYVFFIVFCFCEKFVIIKEIEIKVIIVVIKFYIYICVFLWIFLLCGSNMYFFGLRKLNFGELKWNEGSLYDFGGSFFGLN